MGMILGLATLGDDNIARLLAEPRAASKPSLLDRLLRRTRAEPPPPAPFTLSAGEGASTDLDKAWHGIHYLLTGTAWEGRKPLNFLVAGGRPVGDVDVGYGPARVLSAGETRAVQAALAQIDDEALGARFDPAVMMKESIYPEIWDRPQEEDDSLAYLMEHVRILRGFLAQAAEQNLGLVVYLS